MKTKEEIFKQSIISYALFLKFAEAYDAERSRLGEKANENSEYYSYLSSKAIIKWLKKNKLFSLVSKTDKELLKQKQFDWDGPTNFENLLYLKLSAGIAQILLWSIGLTDQKVNYFETTTEDTELMKKIGLLENDLQLSSEKLNYDILKSAIQRPEDEISDECDITAIINWRLTEYQQDIFDEESLPSLVSRIFDEHMGKLAETLPIKNNDLLIGTIKQDTRVNDASSVMIEMTQIIAENYQRAYEWLLNEETWEDTTADT